MRTIKIKGREIGPGCPVYVIAEIGINHNGQVELAKEMVAAAWENGADAVKIQTFITKRFLHPSHPGYQYDIDAEIPHDREAEIWEFARKRGINLFSTPEEFESLEFIRRQDPAVIKIAAMDFNFKKLVQKAAGIGKPLILSSGMCTLEEVLRTARWVEEAGNREYAVLHCVSCYPTPPQACNLKAIRTMQAALDCPVGFSDHTVGVHIPLAAAVLGASIIEKHFTIDKNLPGPDQKSSMDPGELRALTKALRDIESAIGHGRKEPAPEEQAPRLFKRRGVYAAHDLQAEVILKEEDVLFFAPSAPDSCVTDWPMMEGRKLARAVAAMTRISRNDLRS